MMTDQQLGILKEEIVSHTITRTHAAVLAISTIAVSCALAYGAFLTTVGDLRKAIELNERGFDAKVQQLRLEQQATFVKKEDLTFMTAKLDALTTSLATLHGLLQGQQRVELKK
jgi:hypothetical protein